MKQVKISGGKPGKEYRNKYLVSFNHFSLLIIDDLGLSIITSTSWNRFTTSWTAGI